MKCFLWSICILSTIVSCSTDNILEDQASSTPLLFDINKAEWGPSFRSSYTNDITISDMIVYGYHTQNDRWTDSKNPKSPTFFNGVVISYDNGVWTYNPLRYFFPEGYHSFFAYAPFKNIKSNKSNSFSISDTGEPILRFTLPEEVTDHYDLLVGYKIDVTANQENAPVEIQFVHATTKITFSAGIAPNYALPPFLSVKIDSISFNNIYSSGEIHPTYHSDIINISWTNLASIKDIDLSIDNQALRNTNLTTTSSPLLANNKAIYMIPQVIESRSAKDYTPTLTVKYVIYNNITNINTSYSYSFDLSHISKEWLQGQALDFQIAYNGTENPLSLILVDPGSDGIEDLGPPIS